MNFKYTSDFKEKLKQEKIKKFKRRFFIFIIITLNITISLFIFNYKFKGLHKDIKNKTDLEKKIVFLQKEINNLNTTILQNQKIIEFIEQETGIITNSKTLNQGGVERTNFENIIIENITDEFYNLNNKLKTNSNKIEKLKNFLNNRKEIFKYIPTLWPCEAWVSSKYGYRKSPFTGKKQFHEGMDLSAWSGTKIFAAAEGEVVFAGQKSGYGNFVLIKHKFGYSTAYGHCKKILVNKNQKIFKGQLIATVGNTGRSTGPHLHYEVRINGIPVNPEPYLVKHVE